MAWQAAGIRRYIGINVRGMTIEAGGIKCRPTSRRNGVINLGLKRAIEAPPPTGVIEWGVSTK